MKTGFRGTFIISWSKTEVDGLPVAPVSSLSAGATWAWFGEAVRVDGPSDVLCLDQSKDDTILHQRAAKTVHRLVGRVLPTSADSPVPSDRSEDILKDSSFMVTDGAQTYRATIIDVPGSKRPLLMFVNELPPKGTDLWVVRCDIPQVEPSPRGFGEPGVICFTPGTMVATASGLRPVETISPDDVLLTKDNGPQKIIWRGHRRMTGARLFAMPHLRPVRLRADALGGGIPDAELLVSPEHQVVLRGTAARRLFNETEVLVQAKELVNDHTIWIDTAIREVTYIHLMFEQHQVIWANGVETESFHPASTALDMIDPSQRQGLKDILPDVAEYPMEYGAFARRRLTPSEAAILLHDAA
ncbi:Hint domain-containing protein [Algirhabdus cladophorae]|uniref:Hint domain-containing protein n=1 Tax=Algirhabdus cladophorae TaxID=3377108 RepID=UPI003B848CAF